jgi:hypothetical protein
VSGANKPVPAEIKYGRIELAVVLAFMNAFGIKHGYVIANKEGEENVGDNHVHVLNALKLLLDPSEILSSQRT